MGKNVTSNAHPDGNTVALIQIRLGWESLAGLCTTIFVLTVLQQSM
jgi:hypothetical protein